MYAQIKEFLYSLLHFLELYMGGFRIHKSGEDVKTFAMYSFWWFDKRLSRFPDIDMDVDGKQNKNFYELINGNSVVLVQDKRPLKNYLIPHKFRNYMKLKH